MTRLKDGPGEENNPIVQYQEWTEHRYDRGHWLGGRVDPVTRSVWSAKPGQRRTIGGVIVGLSLVALLMRLPMARRDLAQFIAEALSLAIVSIPGFIMLLARDGKLLRRKHGLKDETPPSGAHAPRHHGHGRFSDHH